MSDLTQELIDSSQSQLSIKSLYINNNDNGANYDGVNEAYNGSGIAIVATNSETLTYYDPNNVAAQLLKANPKYKNIILVADGRFGVAGKNSDSILKILNENKESDAGTTLLKNSQDIIKVNKITTTTVQNKDNDSNTAGGIVVGSMLATILILIVLVITIGKKSTERKNNKNLTTELKKTIEPLDENSRKIKELKKKILEWSTSNKNSKGEKFDLTEIAATSREIVDHWNELNNPMAKNNAEQIISVEIPKTLDLFYSLPVHYHNISDDGEKTPRVIVMEQLDIMNNSLRETLDALYDGKLNELEIQSVFIKDKYKNNINSLGGDL